MDAKLERECVESLKFMKSISPGLFADVPAVDELIKKVEDEK